MIQTKRYWVSMERHNVVPGDLAALQITVMAHFPVNRAPVNCSSQANTIMLNMTNTMLIHNNNKYKNNSVICNHGVNIDKNNGKHK